MTKMAIIQIFSLLFFTIAVFADNPTVTIKTTDPQVDEIEGVIIQQKGKDVQLTCLVMNKPEDSEVQWTMKNERKNSSTVQIATATRSYDAFKWAIDTPAQTSWRLRIQNAQITSEGVYTCKVEVSNQVVVKDSRELRVVQKPEIADLQTSTDMYFNSGDRATLECYATGHPPPTVTWTRLAGELLPNGGNALQANRLYIAAIQSDHAGVYICTASNSAGTNQRRILITVQFAPVVTATTAYVRQKVGYVKQLVCNIKGYPLPAMNQISWSRESRPVVPDERIKLRNIPGAYNRITSILDIRGVKEEDFGRFRCSVGLEEGISSAFIELLSSDVPTKDRSNRIVAGSSIVSIDIVLTILMLLSVMLLHRMNFH